MQDHLTWHKFTKKTIPKEETQIVVCRDFTKDYGHCPFFVIVNVDVDCMTYKTYDGLREFEPERNDRWAYIPYPEV